MAEEKKAGPLAHLFHYLGLAACGYMTFMGLIYISNGSVFSSAILALLVLVVFAVLVHYLCVWKAKKQRSNTDLQSKTPEVVLGGIYFVMFLLATVACLEYLVIEMSQKDQIKRAGYDKIADLENLQKEYQAKIQVQKNEVRTKATASASYFQNTKGSARLTHQNDLDNLLGANTVATALRSGSFQQSIEQAAEAKADAIQRQYALDSFDKASEPLVRQSRQAFEGWNQLQVGFRYKDLDHFFVNYLARAKEKGLPDFSYEAKTPHESLFNLSSNINSGGAMLALFIGLLLIIHLCILAPYFSTERQQRYLAENRVEYRAEGSLREFMNK